MDAAARDQAVGFALELSRALHRYGTPAHRLEEMMRLVVERLGLEGQFFATPTGIFASFGKVHEHRTTLLRVEPGEVNLEKMAELDELVLDVLRGNTCIADGSSRVAAIVDAPARYRPALTTLCFGLSSGAVARIVGGGWREVVAAALIGLALGSLGVLLSRWQSHIYEPTAALLATALAFALAGVLAPMSIPIVTLAGLIVLIPGLTLTVAMRELATRNLVAGTARLMGALLVFFEMGFGATLGGQIYRVLPPIDIAATPITLPGWTEWLAFVCSPISLMVLFRARPRDAGWVMFGCTASFLGSRFGSGALGPENGAFVGALALGVAGNLFTRLRNRPAAVMTVPGLMLLVPGSVGFTSLSHFLDRDVVTGVEAAFRMVIVAVALVTGLLVANVAIPPRRIL